MMFKLIVLVTLVSSTIAQQCANKNNLRLVGGSQNGMGRLEVRNSDGTWGSVCPDGWSSASAGVACRQLCGEGVKDVTSLPAAGRFGAITNAIKQFDTECDGSEASLADCSSRWNTTRKCYEDAAVGLCCHSGGLCDGQNKFLAPRLRYVFKCAYDSYTVFLESPPSTGQGLVYPFELYSQTNPRCRDRVTNQNRTHNWITIPFLSDCGVKQEVDDNGLFIYKHSVLIKGQTTGPAITRLFQWVLPVGCQVDRILNTSIHLDSSIPEGPLDNLTQQNETLKLDMTIKVFEDPSYTVQLPTPVKIPVGTPIYIELSVDKSKLQGGDKKAKIIVTKCVTYPFDGSDSGLHYTLIDERFAKDKGTRIAESPLLNIVRFKMQTIKIGLLFREVYLSCAAYVCPAGDKARTCTDRRAMVQHLTTATRHRVELAASGSSQQTNSLMSVVSQNFGVELPKFRDGQLTSADVPELEEDDYIRISDDEKQLAYHFQYYKGEYIVGLYKGTGKI